ncbi:MAG: phosphoglycerate kinase [Proteobacteria bacterium]|nr:phosphoglycerate kinase [Pseudomonadota bacterium]NOG60462.1 phosphoglycerate kinase [Pseudomonadota bacterium]
MSILVKIADLDLSGKTVLIREDYNVPIKDGVVTSDVRIQATLPTLEQVLEAGAKIILVSHLGRPVAGEYNETFSLAPVAKSLSEFLGMDVPLIKDWVDGIDMTNHQVVLCENARFEKGETSNDEDLARKMAQLCQVYINDAFATAHRAQASTHGVAKYAAVSAAGPLLIEELKSLSKALREPEKPVIAIVGGSKVSSKLTILETLSEKVDQLIVGGGIANTFLKAAGYEVGKSLYEEDLVEVASKLMKQAEENGCKIPLPVDVICGKEFDESTQAVTKLVSDVEADDMIMDVGPQTSKLLNELIGQAKTIVWNGPLGVFEFDQFSQGTESLANAIAKSNAYSIAGGGDTIAAISKFKIENEVSYISTGGGAFLEFLEGKKLPAIEILEEAARAWEAMEKAREL